MGVTLNGFTIQKSPKDQNLISYPAIVEVLAGVTRTIDIPTEFNGFALSIQLINQDGANPATARINGITTPAFNIPAGGAISFNDQWITQIRIVAGAGGSVIVQLQVVPTQKEDAVGI